MVSGLILNLGMSYTTFGTTILHVLELIQSAFWVQNGKNDGFTKMSVELWKLYIVPLLLAIELMAEDMIAKADLAELAKPKMENHGIFHQFAF